MTSSVFISKMGTLREAQGERLNPQSIHIHHIPKTAGTSLRLDLNEFLHLNIPHTECCFRPDERYHFVTFLRTPLHHVLSQYLECRYDIWGIKVTKHTNFPNTGTIEEGFRRWLNYTYTHEDNFNCYHPYNMQVRSIVKACQNSHKYLSLNTTSLVEARQQLSKFVVVGVTEDYIGGLCLMIYRLRRTLPKWCACEQRSHVTVHNVTHGVPPHNVDNFSPQTLSLAREFVQYDEELYNFGLAKYREDIAALEKQLGLRLQCNNGDSSRPPSPLSSPSSQPSPSSPPRSQPLLSSPPSFLFASKYASSSSDSPLLSKNDTSSSATSSVPMKLSASSYGMSFATLPHSTRISLPSLSNDVICTIAIVLC